MISRRRRVSGRAIAVVSIVLWLLGLVISYTMGGFIHIILVLAVVMNLVNLISAGDRFNELRVFCVREWRGIQFARNRAATKAALG
jgi:hypothetical protein